MRHMVTENMVNGKYGKRKDKHANIIIMVLLIIKTVIHFCKQCFALKPFETLSTKVQLTDTMIEYFGFQAATVLYILANYKVRNSSKKFSMYVMSPNLVKH